MIDWAKREVNLLLKKESSNEDAAYLSLCCKSALKAFESLLEDGHSNNSIAITKGILDALIDGRPLTPIEDVDEEWELTSEDEKQKLYQSKRYSSLFKSVYPDGHIKYDDIDRVCICDKKGLCWHNNSLATDLVNEMYPINFPYMPPLKPYKVYTEDFWYMHPDEVGLYDHMALRYVVEPDGDTVNIGLFYKEVDRQMVEIEEDEWNRHYVETFAVPKEEEE